MRKKLLRLTNLLLIHLDLKTSIQSAMTDLEKGIEQQPEEVAL